MEPPHSLFEFLFGSVPAEPPPVKPSVSLAEVIARGKSRIRYGQRVYDIEVTEVKPCSVISSPRCRS
jgi:hypothetical protein